MSLDAFAQELSRLRIADKYHAVVLELSNGEVDRLKTIKPEDFMGKEDAEGFKVSAPVARELVRQFRLPQQPGSPRMRDSLKRKDFDLTEYKQQWFDKEWTAPEWPRIQKSAEFEAKFNRLWSKHDDDGSGTISGGETVAFMDDLTDLLLQTYATDESRSPRSKAKMRQQVQNDLDGDGNGNITRAEAEAFIFRRAAGSALQQTA